MEYDFIRGDTKTLIFKIKKDGTEIDDTDLDDIEFQINKSFTNNVIKKLMSAGQVSYDSDEHYFSVYLTQEDTFTCKEGINKFQIRLVYGGEVKATLKGDIFVGDVLSEGVLSTPNKKDKNEDEEK